MLIRFSQELPFEAHVPEGLYESSPSPPEYRENPAQRSFQRPSGQSTNVSSVHPLPDIRNTENTYRLRKHLDIFISRQDYSVLTEF